MPKIPIMLLVFMGLVVFLIFVNRVDAAIADLIIAASGVTLSLLSLTRLFYLDYLEKNTRRFFFQLFGMVNIYCMCLLLRELIRQQTEYSYAVVSRLLFFVQALISSFLTIMILAFLLYQTGEKEYRKTFVFQAAMLLWMLNALLLIYNQFTGVIFSVDNHNHYSRGPFFLLQMISPGLIMLLNILTLIHRRKKLSRKQRTSFAAYAVIPLVCMLIQSLFFGLHLIALGTVISTLIMYNYSLVDQMERFIRSQEENAKLKIDILLAQIQPHFLFNALTSVRYLCKENPETAADAIGDLTVYLRHNMDSMISDKPISFQKELSHVETYLKLQKLRFGDDLQVTYHLECTDFCLPSLTLQPLVENAVSYGVRKSPNGVGTVTIRSAVHGDYIELTVEDDGPGFEYEEQSDEGERSHIGLKNVKQRLRDICNAELVIDSALGKGTRATILLPKKASVL